MPWYYYVTGDPADPTSYLYKGNTFPACPGGCRLCEIYAAYNTSSNPFPAAITDELYLDIKAALANCQARGNAYTSS